MGRNPVVGRQGPAHHAAVIPEESVAKRLRVKQIRSGIGHAETMNRTLKAIGLRHYQAGDRDREYRVDSRDAVQGAAHDRCVAGQGKLTMAAKKQGEEIPVERISLSNLRPVPGSHRTRKRVGRGPGSGTGQDVRQGPQGSKARSGGATNPGFEGGQMPMYRRLPKRGFTNPFKVTYLAVNLKDLERITGRKCRRRVWSRRASSATKRRRSSCWVTARSRARWWSRASSASASARAKIEAAGGRVED